MKIEISKKTCANCGWEYQFLIEREEKYPEDKYCSPDCFVKAEDAGEFYKKGENMLNLKLYDYGTNPEHGKPAKRVLQLGKDFVYGGDFIDASGSIPLLRLDQKDPLNRFNGLFDGRTYGEGRFILEIDDQDGIIEATPEPKNVELFRINNPHHKYELHYFVGKIPFTMTGPGINAYRYQTISNLHLQPELWEKCKKIV